MRRDVAEQFIGQLPDGFSCVTTLTMSYLMNGYSVRYTPIEYRPRAGRSQVPLVGGHPALRAAVIRMMLSHDPLRVFMPVAAILVAAFAAKLGYDLAGKDLRVATNTLLLGFAAIQTLAIGLLADLVVRVSRPVHLRPPADVTEVAKDN